MSSTLVAVFDDHASAKAAGDALVAQHLIKSSDVSVTSADAEASGDMSGSGSVGEHRHGIRAFFARLFGLGDDDERSGHYAEAVRRGSAVLSVTLSDDAKADEATQLLEDCGAIDVDERVDRWKTEGYTGYDAAAPALSADEQAQERDKIKVLQEELKVGKRTVDRGGVRVHRRIIETPVTEQVQLRDQEAVIERVPVDRPASEADFDTFKDADIELRETAEEPVVEKSARVVEEVKVGVKSKQRTETVHDSVRRTDVDVDRLADGFERPVTRRPAEAGERATAGMSAYSGPERRFNTQPYAGPERRMQAGGMR